ncbi:MAG: hypothetical protein UX09_C0031G0008 [Candidatus Uhrbacteria bacterium GW2011_GWE2_45_35]|uniref:Uncharacterized protein n=2 Tax=Candidatus Uhriibacteriota TaxID=1752732 RepID=A0A0G1JF54_9BACT|nr:MAG: hypothetical protein UW63_C0041G0008 [Candidatus Uhrbacteria bacterium GW2011_GWF2_44_350]KKU07312.1 MAG: hypothetical protein UX09_C0031G0008 [Candidatus Uhrbacteria bacterium GW2011_GWE2_45_35]HBR80814.1 hypothetical protein [Candidatus Uhrbacteria bacterium]HCU32144.1 hypothetical protein [Candidatus Uhrbacteria bacterium]
MKIHLPGTQQGFFNALVRTSYIPGKPEVWCEAEASFCPAPRSGEKVGVYHQDDKDHDVFMLREKDGNRITVPTLDFEIKTPHWIPDFGALDIYLHFFHWFGRWSNGPWFFWMKLCQFFGSISFLFKQLP